MIKENIYKILVDECFAGLFMSQGNKFTYTNHELAEMLKYEDHELQDLGLMDIIHPEFKETVAEKISASKEKGNKFSHELKLLTKDKSTIWAQLGVAVVKLNGDTMMIGILTDINNQKEKQFKLESLVDKDFVTEVYNKEGIEEQLRIRIAKDLRENQTGAIIALELEDLVEFEKRFGPDFKDKLLNDFTKRLEKFIRESDLIARIGEGKFILFLDNFNNSLDAANIADRINQEFIAPYFVEEKEVKIDFKMGVSVFPGDGQNPMQLLENATRSLNNSKKSNTTYLFFDDEMNEKRMVQSKKKDQIVDALRNNRIEPYYQPIIGKDGNMYRFEALARLFTEDGDVIPAKKFINIAEKTGLVQRVDEMMFDKVFKAIQKWYLAGERLCGSVNISSSEIKEELYDRVMSKLNELEIPPSLVYLEITENTFFESTNRAIESMERLRNVGVRFSIDDFGIGRSNLFRLHSLPIDEIKIDKTFAEFNRDSATTHKSIIKAALEIAEAKDVELVVEGVESQSAMETLFQLGVDYVQGYYFKEPLPEPSFENLIGKYSVHDFRREFWI